MVKKEKKKMNIINVLGLIGALLWVSTIFIRGSQIIQTEFAGFLLGVAPNFGVGLLLPALVVSYYPMIFKKNVTLQRYLLVLLVFFLTLIGLESIHDIFLNSRFDLNDIIASFIALGVMAVSFYRVRSVAV